MDPAPEWRRLSFFDINARRFRRGGVGSGGDEQARFHGVGVGAKTWQWNAILKPDKCLRQKENANTNNMTKTAQQTNACHVPMTNQQVFFHLILSIYGEEVPVNSYRWLRISEAHIHHH